MYCWRWAAFLSWLAPLCVAHVALASESIPARDASILAPAQCSPTIGKGGNLRSGSRELAGKCEGAGVAPILKRDGEGGQELLFSVSSSGAAEKDRTELAFTRERLKFGEDVFVSFEIRIPDGAAATSTWYYLVQFWQGGELPPIGGLRMDRGASHAATFMARGGANATGDAIAKVSLPPDEWVRFTLRLNVKPEGTSCVWVRRGAAESAHAWCGRMGYRPVGTLKKWYRMKFGIYKGNEPGKTFRAEFRSIRIGRSLREVRP
jgi:hypothetical protein